MSVTEEAARRPGWKRKLPFLRWSVLRMVATMKRQLLVHWQVGDGREEKAARYVLANKENEGRTWRSTEHQTHAEHQTVIKDLVLESERLT